MNLDVGRRLETYEIADLLAEARARTLELVGRVSEEDLLRQHDPLMSPIIWDLGHIAHFEEVWLLEKLAGGAGGTEGLRGIYNPFETARADRGTLRLPTLEECLEFMAAVRRSVLDRLQTLDLSSTDPLLREGLVFHLVLQHEYQHNETILQTLQLKQGEPYRAPRAYTLPAGTAGEPAVNADMVAFPGGIVDIGTDDRTPAYDNERPRHRVEIAPFRIDATPVTNQAYTEFIEAGGYRDESLWSEAGWAWLTESGAEAPKYWEQVDGEWHARVMDASGPVDPRRPVCHVCFHEAEAFARFVGKRLPTEFEWEAAASWDPQAEAARSFPWGDEPLTPALANVDALSFQTAPVWSYESNVSPIGCYGMIGDVWEWTATDFHGYPGYETFPYPEYSEAFFGDGLKVLRGGSWASRSGAIRTSFRNWDLPIRRQIFSGLRCASDD